MLAPLRAATAAATIVIILSVAATTCAVGSGGGVKPGFSYGATDEYGFYALEDKVHVHDLHATMLALLGVDHERLTYRDAGRDFRLTDVAGRVVSEIFA